MKSSLPTGWIERPLEELNQREAQSIDPGKYPDEVFELYSVPSFDSLIPEIITGSEIKSGKQRVEVGDVLICKINPRINRVWIVGEKGEHEQIGSTEWIIIKPIPGVLPEYLLHFCRSNKFRALLNSEISGVGGSLTRARPKLVAKYKIPLAPFAEQRRIVAQLDAVMQKLEASQERLDKLPDLLKKFRQAVLAAAVSGKLTEAWRAQQPQGETGADLLDRIRAERRAQWEEKQRAKLSGKQLSLNDGWKSKYEEPAAPDTSELPELPDGWAYLSIQQVGNVLGGKRLPAGHDYVDMKTAHPYLRVKDFENGTISQTELKYLSPATAKLISRYTITEKDVFISIAGSIGITGIIPIELSGANLTENAAKISNLVGVLPRYVHYFLSSLQGTKQVLDSTVATSQPKLALFRIEQLIISLPSIAEQQEIVRQVNHYFELADQLEARFEQAAALVEQLPQALLAKAFSGQLVPQDLSDEPASELLARLHTEPAASAKGKRGRKAKVAAEAPLFE